MEILCVIVATIGVFWLSLILLSGNRKYIQRKKLLFSSLIAEGKKIGCSLSEDRFFKRRCERFILTKMGQLLFASSVDDTKLSEVFNFNFRLIEECGVAMYCDMHAHSRKHNIFIYGCENKRNPEKRLTEQVFPLMLHKNSADRVGLKHPAAIWLVPYILFHIILSFFRQFSFESCKFKIQRSKEGTGRIVVWMLGITNSYTIEASFGGSSLGSRKGTHFNIQVKNI